MSLCLQVHRGVYEAAEILYQRFLPLVVEHLASQPFAKIAFTVRLVHCLICPCLSIRQVSHGEKAQACLPEQCSSAPGKRPARPAAACTRTRLLLSPLLTGLLPAAGTLTGWQPGHSAAAHVSQEGRDPSSGNLAHLHLWSPCSLLRGWGLQSGRKCRGELPACLPHITLRPHFALLSTMAACWAAHPCNRTLASWRFEEEEVCTQAHTQP